MGLLTDLGTGLRAALRVASRPVRRARGRGGVVLQAYRGYGSRDSAFVIGRVFRQRSTTPVRGPWDLRRHARDVLRRLVRRPVRGAVVRGRLLDREAASETDSDGYFRLNWRLEPCASEPAVWQTAALFLDGVDGAVIGAESEADVYIAPPRARFVVISDIDDTVMFTGVANKAAMMWRLFVQGAGSRTAFPGVAELYRALHDGASGNEGNPMLYVSRAPWGIYEVLEEFFRRHQIPAGPVLLLREWGVSWKSPLPRRAEDHKRVLIEHIMETYRHLPVILIGDSGQHDPAIYRQAVERYGARILAVYIRDVSKRDASIHAEIEAMQAVIRDAGSELVLAADTGAMAEHAAAGGLIAPGDVDAVRAERVEDDAEEAAPRS